MTIHTCGCSEQTTWFGSVLNAWPDQVSCVVLCVDTREPDIPRDYHLRDLYSCWHSAYRRWSYESNVNTAYGVGSADIDKIWAL